MGKDEKRKYQICFQCGHYKYDCKMGNKNIISCSRYELNAKYVN